MLRCLRRATFFHSVLVVLRRVCAFAIGQSQAGAAKLLGSFASMGVRKFISEIPQVASRFKNYLRDRNSSTQDVPCSATHWRRLSSGNGISICALSKYALAFFSH